MASHTPGSNTGKLRHRITSIRLEPSTATRAINLKILVDGQEAHRLTAILPGGVLRWDSVPYCNTNLNSQVEIRVYEKHFLGVERIGTLSYVVSDVASLSEISIDSDTKRFKTVLSFPTPELAKEAPIAALEKAQETKQKARPLERLGPAREVLKAVLDGGEILSELHPVAKIVVGFCNIAWKALEKQEQLDAKLQELIVGLTGMLSFVSQIQKAAKLSQLQDTMEAMKNLIEDASDFIVKYRSNHGPVQGLRAVIGSEAQEQVQNLLDQFGNLKEKFDRGLGVETFETVGVVNNKVDAIQETVDAIRKVQITDAQRTLWNELKELKPVGSARYDSTRTCHPGTRTGIITDIVAWCQRRDTSGGLLWVYGQAGLGKSSIATSVYQKLEEEGFHTAEFFCKQNNPEHRDPQRVLTTIVYRLALCNSGYSETIASAIRQDSALCSSPIETQFDNLVKNPLKTLSHTVPARNLVVIVDALDECGDNNTRRQLLAYLHQMSQLVPWLKVIVTSRPDPDIVSFFGDTTTGVSRRDLYRDDASDDIKSYIQHRMKNNKKSNYLPPEATQMMTKRAEGLFIWATTACEFILGRKILNPKSHFELVIAEASMDQTSNPLDALYKIAIETSLDIYGAENAQYIQECLGAIIVCSTLEPLSVASLAELLGDQMEMGVVESVVDNLGSVLYVDTAKGGIVRVYHHSFTDFMISSDRSKQYCVDLKKQNAKLARCCLKTMIDRLRFNICGLETSHILNEEVPDLSARVDARIQPHLRYSCLYWTDHITRSEMGEAYDLLRQFMLGSTLVYWIEVLSLLGKLNVATHGALNVSEWCQEIDDVTQCAKDIHRFILAFYDPISKSTPHLYVSALAFCPTRIAFVQNIRATFKRTLAVTRGGKEGWSPWLRCISHPNTVWAVGISNDGRRIVSGSEDHTVRLWDAVTGEALGSPLVGHAAPVFSVGFSPDSRCVISGSNDGTVRVWEADAGAMLGNPLVGHSSGVMSVGFSPDSHCIVSGSSDKTVRVWDADTGAAIGDPLVGHSGIVCFVGFSPDGRHIVSGSEDSTVRLWDTDTGAMIGGPLVGHSGYVNSVGFSPDGRRIVSGSNDNTVRLWDVDTGAAIDNPLVGHSGCVMSVGFSSDGCRIVSGSLDNTVRVWDTNTGAAIGHPLVGHSAGVTSVGFSPDGYRIVSGSLDMTARVWDADTDGVPDDPLAGYTDGVQSVGFSLDGRRIVSGSSDKTVRVWDSDTGAAIGRPLVGHSHNVSSVGFSFDGRRIVSGSDDSTVRVWDADTGAAIGDPLVGHSHWVVSVGFSPDGRRIVSGSFDKTVRVWDVDTSAAIGDPLVGHSGVVRSVGFSPDGRRIVSGSDDRTVRVWDAHTGAAIGDPLVGHSGAVRSVGFSPDGRFIVSGGEDKMVRVWDADTGAVIGDPLVGHSWHVTSVGFSRDSRRIVSGSGDKTVRVWDVDTGAAIGDPLVGHSYHILSVGFSPDGRRIISGSWDDTVRVWDSVLLQSQNMPHNTSRMSESLSDDGWVRHSNTNALLIWLPEEYRRSPVDDSLFVISQKPAPRPVQIDSSKFVHGFNWTSIYTP